jgi:hypothetical protein
MTAKEKAEDLVNKFCEYSHTDFNPTRGGYQFESQIKNAKQCALIAVDEIMKAVGWEEMELGVDRDNYWREVKTEIEKL